MRSALFILYGITAIATTSASPVASPIDSLAKPPVATSISDPVTPQVGVTGTTPEDISKVIGEMNSLASDVFSQGNKIGGGGVEVQVIGNTYLRCRDMVDGIQQAFNKIGNRPSAPFGYDDQKGICFMFDAFGMNQSKLITMLVRSLGSIARDGFIDHFGDCFNRLQPALGLFIDGLTAYTPNCEFEMLRRKDQLEIGFSSAIVMVQEYRDGHTPERIPLPLR